MRKKIDGDAKKRGRTGHLELSGSALGVSEAATLAFEIASSTATTTTTTTQSIVLIQLSKLDQLECLSLMNCNHKA